MNYIGLVPTSFAPTSHIIVTFALALLVIGTVVVYGVSAQLAAPRGAPLVTQTGGELVLLGSGLGRAP